MNEWKLQEVLTDRWIRDGLVVADERCMLVAWEVMAPSWRINSASHHWSEPSIDFIAANVKGTLVGVELKAKLTGRVPVWAAAFQATAMVMSLRRSTMSDGLSRAFVDCYSGSFGRRVSSDPRSLDTTHAEFFGLTEPVSVGRGPWRCAIAAPVHGPSTQAVVDSWNAATWSQRTARARRMSERNRRSRPIDRFLALEAATKNDIVEPLILMKTPDGS